MRAAYALAAVAMLLTGCGPKSGSDQTSPSADSEPAPPTSDQIKILLAALPPPFNAADPEHGKHVFSQCAACHTNTKGAPNMTGPNLYGVFGRPAGSVADYDYSFVVKSAGFSWDAARINTWITNPQAMLPGTKMSFAGLSNPQDRADLIAYLKVSTTPAP